MKLHTKIMVFSDHAMISQDGKLNIIGIFDQVGITTVPGSLSRGFLVALISGGKPNTQYDLVLKVKNINGVEPPLKPMNVSVKMAPNGNTNLLVQLINLTFNQPGEYTFEIQHEQAIVGSADLKVFHVSSSENKKNVRPN